MGNWAFFNGCSSRDVARRYEHAEIAAGRGPELSAKYSIPLFWIAGFAAADLVMAMMRYPNDPDATDLEFVVPCTTARDFVARLERRRALVSSLLPEPLGDFYREWTRFVLTRYPDCVMIRPDDVFSMYGYEEASAKFRQALEVLDRAETSGRLDDAERNVVNEWSGFVGLCDERVHGETAEFTAERWRAALSGDAATPAGTALWPTRPTAIEIRFAGTLREAKASAKFGTPEFEEQSLTQVVREGRFGATPGERLKIGMAKLRGDLPAGVDARSKALRKVIGGGQQLLDAVRNGFIALCAFFIGGLLVWVGVAASVRDWKFVAAGVVSLAFGAWLARSAWRSARTLRAIVRA